MARVTGLEAESRELTEHEQTIGNAARDVAFTLYEGVVVAHRSELTANVAALTAEAVLRFHSEGELTIAPIDPPVS